MLLDCPGARQFVQPTPEFRPCPFCHAEIEIWSDQVETKCDKCGQTVTRARLQGCIDHCEKARECLGDELYERLVAKRPNP